jgi:acyl carrier protein phosphodiesterase
MNYLFHLYLSGEDPDILTGNFMGDFVKGRLGENYPPRLRRGLELHRSIDSFAQRQPQFNRSRLRLHESFGLYRGVLVDLFYDHFLASSWGEWSGEPLAAYLRRVRRVVESKRPYLPERLATILPVIFEEMIPSYLREDGIAAALVRMSRRVQRENPLGRGGAELRLHYEGLREDFVGFLPAALEHARHFLADDSTVTPSW